MNVECQDWRKIAILKSQMQPFRTNGGLTPETALKLPFRNVAKVLSGKGPVPVKCKCFCV